MSQTRSQAEETSAGDRAVGTGRRDGTLFGHAHVHHLRPSEDRHEGCWTSTCSRALTPEGLLTIVRKS